MATAAVEVEALSRKLSELLGKHPEVSPPWAPSCAPNTVNEAAPPVHAAALAPTRRAAPQTHEERHSCALRACFSCVRAPAPRVGRPL